MQPKNVQAKQLLGTSALKAGIRGVLLSIVQGRWSPVSHAERQYGALLAAP